MAAALPRLAPVRPATGREPAAARATLRGQRSPRAHSASSASYRATAAASASPCYPAPMEPPEHSERLTWLVCCTVGTIVGLSAIPLVLLLPAEYTRPLCARQGGTPLTAPHRSARGLLWTCCLWTGRRHG